MKTKKLTKEARDMLFRAASAWCTHGTVKYVDGFQPLERTGYRPAIYLKMRRALRDRYEKYSRAELRQERANHEENERFRLQHDIDTCKYRIKVNKAVARQLGVRGLLLGPDLREFNCGLNSYLAGLQDEIKSDTTTIESSKKQLAEMQSKTDEQYRADRLKTVDRYIQDERRWIVNNKCQIDKRNNLYNALILAVGP